MPRTIFLKTGPNFAVADGTVRRCWPWFRKRRARQLNGDIIIWNQGQVIFELYTPQAEFDRRREEAKKKNPNPGKDPRLVVPR